MTLFPKLRADLEREALALQDRIEALQRELAATVNEGARRVLKLQIQDAHTEHQRALKAFFAIDKG